VVSQEQQKRSNERNRKKVLVVDDQPIVREGLTYLINEEEDIAVCGSVETISQVMEAIQGLEPDLVTIDLYLQDASGLDLIKDIKIKFPSLPVLVLSVQSESIYAERVIRAGAKGYITKYETTGEVLTAIRKVLAGGLYLSPRMNDKLLCGILDDSKSDAPASPVNRLTDRELEVFTLLGRGRGTRQIAEQLYISVKTVETYRLRIKEKLNIETAPELLQQAFQWANEQDKCHLL